MEQQIPEGMSRYDASLMGLNTENETILNNIRVNIKRFLPQLKPYRTNTIPIAIVGGGPSLLDTVGELREQYESGTKLVAVNNTHDWLLDNGFKPSVHVMVDTRETNKRFVTRPIPTCKYFIASNCHPSVFDALEGQQVYIWHPKNDIGEEEILDEYYLGRYTFVIGGSTVVLRTIWLMRVLGFTKFDLYGFDSCLMRGQHHAYEQQENDGAEVRKVFCAGKQFEASAWMVSQAEDFMHFVKRFGNFFDLNVHGSGLLAHIIQKGAENLIQ